MDEHLLAVQNYVLSRGIPVPGWRAADDERGRFRAAVAQALVELGLDRALRDGRLAGEAARIAGHLTGVGVLTPFLSEPGVEEVIVRGGFVQIERRGRIEDAGALAGDEHFEAVARRAADLGHRTLKGDRPYVLVDLPDGSRFTAVVPPLSEGGVGINVRVFSRAARSLEDLAALGAFDPALAKALRGVPPFESSGGSLGRYLRQLAEGRYSLLFSGEFGAGKTTLMSAMSRHIPDLTQLAVVETFQELQIAHPHPLRLVVPEARENFPTLAEVVNVVVTRMRPDLIVIGELVAGEAVQFLRAANLGKRVWATIHGNSAYDALLRLEDLALASGLPLEAIQVRVARGIDAVVHLRQDAETGRRYVAEVAAVAPEVEGGRYRLHTIYDAEGGRG